MRTYSKPGVSCSVPNCNSRAVCKGMCNRHYQAQLKYGDPLARVRPLPGPGICTADGCDAPTRSIGSLYCEKHYMRQRRKGELGLHVPPIVVEHSGGYLLEHAPGHAVQSASGKGRVYQHRKVFFEEHGDGQFQCHVCDAPLTWPDLHVDHLDDNPKNNALDNLKPACPTCNQWRGKAKMARTMRARAKQISAFGEARCLSEWARHVGLPMTTLRRRIKAGWTLEEALTKPSGPTGRKAA